MGSLVNETAPMLTNEQVGPRLFLTTLKSPEIAAAVQPGQFIHMKVPSMADHILRRPFSIYAADAEAGTVDILYQVVGYGSDHMTTLEPGAVTEMIGPVGHGWSIPEGAKKVLIVAGGVGAAPLFMLTEKCVAEGLETVVVLGAQTKDALVCKDRYEALLGAEPRVATDDGSYGRAGFCTSLVEEALAEGDIDVVFVCGPTPLMKIVAGQAAAAGVTCFVSMEKRMACGVGACLSCVVETVDGKKRSCVDGPVFPAEKVVW